MKNATNVIKNGRQTIMEFSSTIVESLKPVHIKL